MGMGANAGLAFGFWPMRIGQTKVVAGGQDNTCYRNIAMSCPMSHRAGDASGKRKANMLPMRVL
jgi:hypothetical protein